MKKFASILHSILFLALFVGALKTTASAQGDAIPRLVEGHVDWERIKGKMGAPRFNQKDLVMYILRQEGFAKWFDGEEKDSWVNDFHFVYMNGDQNLDVVYDGATKYHLGSYSMVMIGDTVLSYPRVYEGRGYITRWYPSETGVGFIVRKDAYGADYTLLVSSYWLDYATNEVSLVWEVAAVGDEEAPIGKLRDQFVLKQPTQLRIAPQILEEGTIDLDQDGTPDLNGNVAAVFDRGSTFVRTFRKQGADGQDWSFVIALDPPKEDFAFGTQDDPKRKRLAAGWVPSNEL